MPIDLSETLKNSLNDVERAAQSLRQPEAMDFIENTARMISACFRRKNKILVAGNGGSLCDSMHFAEELVGQFRSRRPALPAIALADSGQLSCIANDMGYDEVFARSVEAFGVKGDLFIALTTSGNSPNILRAIQCAKERGIQTIAFLGKTGGKTKGLCDLEWIVTGFSHSDRIQEAHMAAIHVIIELIEQDLFQTAP
jgi:D-sedoheptulose 7-phosphate isomerase